MTAPIGRTTHGVIGTMDERDRLRQLEDAVREAVKERTPTPAEQRMSARAASANRRTGLVLLLVVTWVLLGWFWLVRPEWAFGARTTPAASAEVEEARLRFALYLMRGRVEAYRVERGRLPANLAHVGRVEDGVTMRPMLQGYELVGQQGTFTLRLTSAMNPDSFLGGSLDVLQAPKRR
jgi:hypothetical protein